MVGLEDRKYCLYSIETIMPIECPHKKWKHNTETVNKILLPFNIRYIYIYIYIYIIFVLSNDQSQLIAFKIKVFVCIIYVCVLCLFVMYI